MNSMKVEVDGEGFGIPFDYEVSRDPARCKNFVTLKNFNHHDLKVVTVPKDLNCESDLYDVHDVCVINSDFLSYIIRHFAKYDQRTGRILLDLHVPGWEPR